MKVLVIGGTGLISTAITRYLVERSDDITLYNRGVTKAQPEGEVKTIQGDRTDFTVFEARMAEASRFDCVIDMACFVPAEAKSAIRAFKGRIGQYIFCSTVDVYTKPAGRYPIVEGEERQPRPSFPYAFNKAACERLFEEAHRRGDFAVTLIRPAHTYGEGGGLVHTFDRTMLPFNGGYTAIARMRAGKPVVVHGDGSSFWSVCHRDDVGRAFVQAAGNQATFGRGYHVAGEQWLTWDQYHQGVAEAMGVPLPRLVHIPSDLLDQAVPELADWCLENFKFNKIFDNSAAKKDLGFVYTIPWIEGVRRTVAWLDARGRIENSDNYPIYDRIIAAWEELGEALGRELVLR